MEIVENNKDNQVFEFAEFSFYLKEKILRRGLETVSMPPKTCELLAVLLENHGILLTKEELFQKVWADTFVEEANLSHHIAVLRKTLGEDNNGRKFIETVPRRGYRFVESVNEISAVESIELIVKEQTKTQTIISQEIETKNDARKHLPENNQKNRFSQNKTLAVAVIIFLLLGFSFFAYQRWFTATKNETSESSKINIKRLMPDADSFAPSISPDGANIVFLRLEKEKESLWKKNLATNELTQLLPTTPTKDGSTVFTRFSPDGKWIYYGKYGENTTDNSQTIYRTPAGGGTPQKIIEKVQTDFSLSPDGKKLVFARDYRQLIVADIETGIEHIIATRDGVTKSFPSVSLISFGWSPDGQKIICSESEFDGTRFIRNLVEINLQTGEERIIRLPSEIRDVQQIEWMPDGKSLLITCFGKIWQLSYPDSTVKQLTNDTDKFVVIRLSADGKMLVAEQSIGQFNIFIAPTDNPDQKQQVTIGAAASRGTVGVAFLPDGRIIHGSFGINRSDIWLMNEDGSGQRNLTSGSGKINIFPQISTDGKYIFFISNRSGVQQIWRMDTDGGNPKQISQGRESYNFRIAPDNTVYFISYSPDQPDDALYKTSLEGGEAVKIDDFNYLSSPVISPDGKWKIVYGKSTKEDKPQVLLKESATGKISRALSINVVSSNIIACWSADSKSFYYVALNSQELWRQDVLSGEAKQITHFYPLSVNRFNISADSKKFVFSLGNVTNEIVTIQNFEAVK